jgi:hypothetical protein
MAEFVILSVIPLVTHPLSLASRGLHSQFEESTSGASGGRGQICPTLTGADTLGRISDHTIATSALRLSGSTVATLRLPQEDAPIHGVEVLCLEPSQLAEPRPPLARESIGRQ